MVDREWKKEWKQHRTRKRGIKRKLLLPTAIMILFACSAIAAVSEMTLKEKIVSMATIQAEVTTDVAVRQLDGDAIAALQPGDEDTDAYKTGISIMESLLEDYPDIKYIYTLYEGDDGVIYVGMDGDPDASERYDIGTVYDETDEELAHVRTALGGENYHSSEIEDTEDGKLITAYLPLYNSAGEVVAVVGADYDASSFMSSLISLRVRIVVSSIGFILIALLFLYYILGTVEVGLRGVDKKVFELVNNEGDLTKKIEVHSGDELELIANNINEMIVYFHGVMSNISQGAVTLGQTSKQVANHLNEADANVQDVSATMEQMSAAMEETAASMNQIDQLMRQIYAGIQLVMQQSQEGSIFANEIQGRAQGISERAIARQEEAHKLAAEMSAKVNDKIDASKSVEKSENSQKKLSVLQIRPTCWH